jgi:hypothetical protein
MTSRDLTKEFEKVKTKAIEIQMERSKIEEGSEKNVPSERTKKYNIGVGCISKIREKNKELSELQRHMLLPKFGQDDEKNSDKALKLTNEIKVQTTIVANVIKELLSSKSKVDKNMGLRLKNSFNDVNRSFF